MARWRIELNVDLPDDVQANDVARRVKVEGGQNVIPLQTFLVDNRSVEQTAKKGFDTLTLNE